MCPFTRRFPSIILERSSIDKVPDKRLTQPSLGRPDWAKRAQRESVEYEKTWTSKNTIDENHLRVMKGGSVTADSIIGSIYSQAELRIIFLDVDGVLNHPSTTDKATAVCPSCVGKLKSMIELTSVKIVLSSTWRLNKRHRKTLFRYLRAIDVDQGVVVGETRDLRAAEKNRAEEINDWLSNPKLYRSKYNSMSSPWQLVSSWVSLDDLDLANMQPNEDAKSKHIKLDPKLGLCGTESIIATVVDKLLKTRCFPHDSFSSITKSNSFLIHGQSNSFLIPGTKRSCESYKDSIQFNEDSWKSQLLKLGGGKRTSFEVSDTEGLESSDDPREVDSDQRRERTFSKETELSTRLGESKNHDVINFKDQSLSYRHVRMLI